eukprot:scaffold219_cov156-Amphora_coffeaeformis.AAC.5
MEIPSEEPQLYPKVPFPVLCDWIFVQPDKNVDSYTCTLCRQEGIRKSNSPGNLIKHCAGSRCVGFTYCNAKSPLVHQNLQPLYKLYSEWRKQQASANGLGFQREVSPFAKKIRAWIDIVVKCNMPLSVCENSVMRQHVAVPGMSRKTLRKYIIKLADIVGLVIQEQIGPGCCIADAWSCAGVHYLAIYHQWPYLDANDRIIIKRALLYCAPYVNECSFDANSQARTIKAAYDMYGGTAEELVVCLTLDNTNTNPATCRLLRKPMVGAYCHRLNLSSRCFLSEAFDGDLMENLDVIHAIMLRASTLKCRGRLKEFTPLIPQLANKTRWTGLHDMALKYYKMHDYLEKTGDYDGIGQDDIEEIELQDLDSEGDPKTKKVSPNLLSGASLQRFKNDMLPVLKELRRWFITIQHSKLTLHKAREAFDYMVQSQRLSGHSEEFENRLKRDHRLVVFPHFENGVEKIALGKSEELSPAEKDACECLLKSNWPNLYKKANVDTDDEPEGPPSSPTKFLKSLNSDRTPTDKGMESRYISNLDWVAPTTVIVERLFSKNRHVLSFNRRRMLPRVFEAIVFLKENIDYWGASLIQQMVTGKWDERLKEDYNSESDSDDEDMF